MLLKALLLNKAIETIENKQQSPFSALWTLCLINSTTTMLLMRALCFQNFFFLLANFWIFESLSILYYAARSTKLRVTV